MFGIENSFSSLFNQDKNSNGLVFKNDSFNESKAPYSCFPPIKEKLNYQSRTKHRITMNLKDAQSKLKNCLDDFKDSNNRILLQEYNSPLIMNINENEIMFKNNSSANKFNNKSVSESNEKIEDEEKNDDSNLDPPPPCKASFNNENISNALTHRNKNDIYDVSKKEKINELLNNEFENEKLSDNSMQINNDESTKGKKFNPHIKKKISKLPFRYLDFP